MKLSLAIQTPEVPATVPVALVSGTFEEKLVKAAMWGADGVELMTTDPRTLDVEATRALLQHSKLEASAIASGAMAFALGLSLLHSDPAAAARAESRLRDLIDFAAAVGAPVVTIGSFRGRLASMKTGGREHLVRVLRDAAAYAGTLQTRLALEPLNRFETDVIRNAEEGLALIAEVDRPALGLLLDTFHINIEESSWTGPFRLAMAAGRLWHVHLGDNHRQYPGRGLIDFAAIVRALRVGGYAGYLSAELLPVPDPDTAARGTLAFMRPLLEA